MARRTVNLPFNTGSATSANGFGAQDLLSQFLAEVGREIAPGDTIVRIRGYASVGATTNGNNEQWSMGIMLLDPGQSAGTVPVISTDILNLIWRLDCRTAGRVDEVSSGTFDTVDDIYPIETWGMRKIMRVGQELRVLHSSTGVGWNVAGTVRVMLP